MKHNKKVTKRHTNSYKSVVKIYHLQNSLSVDADHGLSDYSYIGTIIIYALSIDNVLKETWKATQNDGSAWSLNPYFTAAQDAVSFRSSKVGDIFELDIGFFKITKSGFVQIKFENQKMA